MRIEIQPFNTKKIVIYFLCTFVIQVLFEVISDP